MRRWMLAFMSVVASMIVAGSAASAQSDADGSTVFTPETFPVGPLEPPGSSGIGGLIVLMLIVGVGISVWKFTRLRDMGMRRGMTRRDASTAALFSEDPAILGMVLKDEKSSPQSGETERATPVKPAASIRQRLAQLEDLRASGAVTSEEAAERRAEILDEI